MAALHHGMDEEAGDDHTEENIGEVGVLGDVLEALGAVEQAVAQHIVDVVQGDADDLAEAQGQDGQIVTGQTEGRDADEDAKQAGHHSAQCKADGKGNAIGEKQGVLFIILSSLSQKRRDHSK